MANQYPDAPLNHFDETEHRRLIASRANAIAYELGEITPTLSFATVGDLSNAYGTQAGKYWRHGTLVHFSIDLVVTPTFTTASGIAEVGGLPYVATAGFPSSFFAVRLSGANVTWPAGMTTVIGTIAPSEALIKLEFQGSVSAGVNLLAADITSANALTIRATGFYPI